MRFQSRKIVSAALTALLAGTVFGCASTQNRNMNPGERTEVSAGVAEMVDDLGEVDVRFADNVYCERVRRVGTHLVTRVCYDSREAARKSRRDLDRLYRGIGGGTAGCTGGVCAGAGEVGPAFSAAGGRIPNALR